MTGHASSRAETVESDSPVRVTPLAAPPTRRYPTEVSEPPRTEQLGEPRDLIDRVRSGDTSVLDDLTRRYGARLYAVGLRYCRTSTEAEDAVQDALLNAGLKLEQFRGDGSLEGWLVRMVANACSHLRRGKKNDATLHAVEVEMPSDADGPEVLTGRGEVARALGEALLELPTEDRLVLLLAEAEDWTAPQIAERLGSTPGAVRTRLTRIRQRLRNRLESLESDGKTSP